MPNRNGRHPPGPHGPNHHWELGWVLVPKEGDLIEASKLRYEYSRLNRYDHMI